MAANEVELVKKPQQQGQYTNLAGISDASKNNLNYYGQGYQQSQRVTDAQNYLQSVIDKKPGEFQDNYAGDIERLYGQVMNRPKFQYDVNQDPAFRQYKEMYTTQGQRAMQDTVGNAAALTGGYGNSWAATAGSQAYQEYLRELNNMVPQLEQQAYQRYAQEGQDLRQNLQMAQGLRDTEYGQYRDTVGDWQTDRSFAAQQYDSEYQKDYNAWMNMLSYWQNLASQENQNYWNQQNYDFQLRQYEDALAAKAAKGGGGSGKKKNTIKQGENTVYYRTADGKYYTQLGNGNQYQGAGPATVKETTSGVLGANSATSILKSLTSNGSTSGSKTATIKKLSGTPTKGTGSKYQTSTKK